MFTLCRNTSHGESVYNLIQDPIAQMMKPPMYRSRYSNMVRSDVCCQKSGCYRTMGLPEVCLCPPQNFLKKQSRAPITVRPAAIPKVRLTTAPCPGTPKCAATHLDGAGDSGASCDPPPCPASDESTPVVIGGGGDCCVPVATGGQCCVPAKPRVPRQCCNRQKPGIPLACTGYAVIQRGKKDFVMDNARKVIRQPGKVPESLYVDHSKGTRFEWRTSGFPRKYVCRGDYGMIPGYLVNRKKELYEADLKAKVESEAADAAAKSKCRHLEECERQSMIFGLKKNWEETFREFQSLPLFIDTEPLTKKKGRLEEALKELEKDIQLMERHNHVFVGDTDKSFYLN